MSLAPRSIAAAGAVASVLIQRVCTAAQRPLSLQGPEAALLFSLERPESGESFASVLAWLRQKEARFNTLGIRLVVRWGIHPPTVAGAWVVAGQGRRAMLLAVGGQLLHPNRRLRPDSPHAVGISVNERRQPVLLDAFADPTELPLAQAAPELERAASLAKYNALEISWAGWS